MVTTKNKRGTANELPHIDIYHNNIFIGYIIRNKSPFARVNENWNFVSKATNIPMLYDKTKTLLIDKINLELSK